MVVAVLVGACSPQLTLPGGAEVKCESNADCPPDAVCKINIARCVSTDNPDVEPPVITDGPRLSVNDIPRADGRAAPGDRIELSFATDEALASRSVTADVDGTTVVLEPEAGTAPLEHRFVVIPSFTTGSPAQITIELIDLAGNEASLSGGSIDVDGAPPLIDGFVWTVPNSRTIANGSDTVVLSAVAETNTTINSVALLGDNAPILLLESTAVQTAVNPAGGVDITVTVDLADSALKAAGLDDATILLLEIVAADDVGNSGTTTSSPLPFDAMPPSAPVLTVLNPMPAMTTNIQVVVGTTDAVEYRVLGVDVTNAGGFLPVVPTAIPVSLTNGTGSKTVRIDVRDAAHNVSSAGEVVVSYMEGVLDTSPPDPLYPLTGQRIWPSPPMGNNLPSSRTLEWTPRAGAGGYTLEIYTIDPVTMMMTHWGASPFSVPAPVDPTATVTFDVAAMQPITYGWQVRADVTVAGMWSPIQTFDLMNEALHVYCDPLDTLCDDTGLAGNHTRPFRSINRALSEALVLGLSDVRIAGRAGGHYAEAVTLNAPISLEGGFAPDFSAADPIMYPTEIQSPVPAGLTVVNIAQTTTVDGLTFLGADGAFSYGMYVTGCDDSLTVKNVIGIGGQATNRSYGITIRDSGTTMGSGPTFEDSTFMAGDVISCCSASNYGVGISSASPTLRNNTIGAGIVDSEFDPSISFGVFMVGFDVNAVLDGNAISSGDSIKSRGPASVGPNISAVYHQIESGRVTFTGNTVTAGAAIAMVSTSDDIYNRAFDVFKGDIDIVGNTFIVGTVQEDVPGNAAARAYGIAVQGQGPTQATVLDNTVTNNGGSELGGGDYVLRGISLRSASVTPDLLVDGNTVRVGTTAVTEAGPGRARLYGMYLSGAGGAVTNNVARVYDGDEPTALMVAGATGMPPDAVVSNNTLHAGVPQSSYSSSALRIGSDQAPVITNNILITDPDLSSHCVIELGVVGDPTSFENNVLIDCNVAYRDENATDLTTEMQLNALSGTVSANNVILPNLMSAGFNGIDDYRLSPSTPASILIGGKDTGGDNCGAGTGSCGNVTEDHADTMRTVPYSVGAFERD